MHVLGALLLRALPGAHQMVGYGEADFWCLPGKPLRKVTLEFVCSARDFLFRSGAQARPTGRRDSPNALSVRNGVVAFLPDMGP